MSKTAPLSVTYYLPSLRTFLHRLRATNTTPSSLASTLLSSSPSKTTQSMLDPHYLHQDVFTQNTDPLRMPPTIAQLGLQPEFTLPGAVGLKTDRKAEEEKRVEHILERRELSSADANSVQDDVNRTVECKLLECPEFIHDEMMLLFPEVSVGRGELCVIILTEKTENDMTAWSSAVEEEREGLLANFIDSAKEVCSRLMAAGFWADFIDPSSGRAFYGCHTQNTLFETDDKFRYLGFEILDLGCCKCIMHPLWGSYTFVGAIFTNSPMTSPVVQEIINL